MKIFVLCNYFGVISFFMSKSMIWMYGFRIDRKDDFLFIGFYGFREGVVDRF